MVFLVALATGLATIAGGLFALKLRNKLKVVLGFSAGAVVGVALFDLLPEALEQGETFEAGTIIAIAALGFFAYLAFDRLIAHQQQAASMRGKAGASTLSLHSILEGIGIGVAFHVSVSAGLVVGFAILVHDMSDGINTVNVVLKNTGDRMQALWWLLLDAVGPLIGVSITFLFAIPETSLAILLAFLSGCFLYIGASDLVPESHHAHPTRLTTAMTLLGAATLFLVVRLAG